MVRALARWLLWQLLRLSWRGMKRASRIGARPALAPDLVNPSANPLINEQLAALTQCQQDVLALRARYLPGVSGKVLEFDMIADAALRSIDDLLLQLDGTRRDLVRTQRPLKPAALNTLLSHGRQLAHAAQA